MNRIETRAVFAGAYRGKRANLQNLRTHSVVIVNEMEAEESMCRKVKAESLADSGSMSVHAQPTCPLCLKKDPRFK